MGVAEVGDEQVLTEKLSWEQPRPASSMQAIVARGTRVKIRGTVKVCRNPADHLFLECAALSKADLLIAGDKDLLIIGAYKGTRFVIPPEYLKALQKHPLHCLEMSMAVDRQSGIPGVFVYLILFLKRASENQVNGSLRISGGMNNEPIVLFQLCNPILNVCSGIAVGVLVGDTGDCAKEGCAHLGNQFFFAVKLISEVVAKGAIQATFVPGAMNQVL